MIKDVKDEGEGEGEKKKKVRGADRPRTMVAIGSLGSRPTSNLIELNNLTSY